MKGCWKRLAGDLWMCWGVIEGLDRARFVGKQWKILRSREEFDGKIQRWFQT
jgi:hypothetical protein